LLEKPILVDQGCSPPQFIGQHLSVGDITSDKLTDLCASEDGRQLALLLIKQEVRNDRLVYTGSRSLPSSHFSVLHVKYRLRSYPEDLNSVEFD